MTAYNYLYLIAIGLIVIGWGAHAYAVGDVTVGAASSSSTAVASPTLAPDGTPIVHKSLHKKKTQTTATTATSSASPPANAVAPAPTSSRALVVPAVTPKPTLTLTPFTPTVETGLPVARHSGTENVTMYSAPISPGGSLPIVTYGGATGFHPPPLTPPKSGATYPSSLVGGVPSLSPGLTSTSTSYKPLPEHKPTHVYPWKINIITTMFWIGEGGSALSATTNLGSAWIEDWRSANGGSDNPGSRRGYLPSGHMATVNPFYVALPFNDLAWPDKAREWVPSFWRRPNREGKQVSWCQHRWVEIKSESGDRCFAQWEDVGPLRTDHAEYVFGDERPDTLTRAGLDVSPAVAQRLNINGDRRSLTRWRFVDDEDVPPGPWLVCDEEALLAKAIKELKNSDPASIMPKGTGPVDDPLNINSNKKRISASKG